MNANAKIHPVILSGGAGSRLWPLSRKLYPKQLLCLHGDHTMIQATCLRVADTGSFAAPIIVANDEHRFTIAEQLQSIGVVPQSFILEPEGRNTAPAIALGALSAHAQDANAVILILPSDHVIGNEAAFLAAIETAQAAAASGNIVTFGIKPGAPETGYGYIKAATADAVSKVERFVEKPDAATAQSYIDDGHYFWNAGIFMARADIFLKELERLAPDILSAARDAMDGAVIDLDFVRPNAEAFAASPSDSIDYAVMEKTALAAVVSVDMAWSDVGSWSSLWQISQHDDKGNATHGDVQAIDCSGSLIRSDGPMVAALGLKDAVIVATKDAVLVADKSQAQNVKKIVEAMKASDRYEPEHHLTVHRPWGSYETTDIGERFQTKRIVVKPGKQLSLQKHFHRAEHWVVVQGTAIVTRDDEKLTLSENESVYIPLGAVHRLENPGKIPLHLVEVQSGAYLGEDDIVRIQDDFGRG